MGFDLIDPYYRFLEFILAGNKLQKCRIAFLNQLFPCKNILILGEGHGRFLESLLKLHPHASITCVDESQNMLMESRKRIQQSNLDDSKVTYIHANALTWEPEPMTYDAIVTQFFLDCFRPDQLQTLIPCLNKGLRQGGKWLLADFRISDQGCLKTFRSKLILKSMYLFFQIISQLPAHHLTPPDLLLQSCDLKLHERQTFEWRLIHSDIWIK